MLTETEARRVLLLQRLESGAATPLWNADDGAWATRQALAAAGDDAPPDRFVAARAGAALQRLGERDAGLVRRHERRVWRPAWLAVAVLVAFAAGLAADELGAPQRVSLLAPAVWAVVAWNVAVYAALLLPARALPSLGVREALAARFGAGPSALTTARAALLLHAASAALALGLIAGLYLRGLVLDYRAGWQSTFLDAGAVQSLLAWLLAPASRVTGIAVADVAPLRVLPGAAATASAAPWIHLYATTLALAVLLLRTLLAAAAAWRARRLARDFPLDLTAPYFVALHPSMRPAAQRLLTLLWVAPPGLAPVLLFGQRVDALAAPLLLLRGDRGDALQLLPAPAAVAVPPLRRRWPRGVSAEQRDWQRLRDATDAVLLVARAGVDRPGWVQALGKPVVVLAETPEAAAGAALPLRTAAAGWLHDAALLGAIEAALGGDARAGRLAAAFYARQQQRLDAIAAELAASLGRIAAARVPLADDGLLARRGAGTAAQRELVAALEAEWAASGERLVALVDGGAQTAALALPAAALRGRVGEGRAALVGGVVTGALAGLKADLLSGGLTMGAGAVAGAVIGAFGGAGVARGVNVVRGVERSHAAWDGAAMNAITQSALARTLALLHPADATALVEAGLQPRRAALDALWARRTTWLAKRADDGADAAALAATLTPLLRQVLGSAVDALAGAG